MGSLPFGGDGTIWTALLKMAGDRTVILPWGWAAVGFDWHSLTVVLLSSWDFPEELLTGAGGYWRL